MKPYAQTRSDEYQPRWIRLSTGIALLAALCGGISLFLHSIDVLRQYDTQMMSYAAGFLHSINEGTLVQYLLEVRKYPLGSTYIFSVFYSVLFVGAFLVRELPSLSGSAVEAFIFLTPIPFSIVSRGILFLSTIATAFLVAECTGRMLGHRRKMAAVLLFVSSPTVYVFSSAIRPHALEMFLTVLTLFTSIRLLETQSLRWKFFSFLSAAIAFATLQNGIFSFLFPLYALFALGRKREMWVFGACFFALSLVLGYPGILTSIVQGHFHGVGLGNSDFSDDSWLSLHGFWSFSMMFGTGEILLLIAVLWCIFSLRTAEFRRQPFVGVILAYTAITLLTFGFNEEAPPRLFLTLVPLFAIIGAPLLDTRVMRVVALVLVTSIGLRCTVLSLRPDTYDLTREFLLSKTSGTIATSIPKYFLGIPPTRASLPSVKTAEEKFLATLPSDRPSARPYISIDHWQEADTLVLFHHDTPPPLTTAWHLCHQSVSAAWPEQMFLWVEMQYALYWLFQTERLGASIDVYCRFSTLPLQSFPSGL